MQGEEWTPLESRVSLGIKDALGEHVFPLTEVLVTLNRYFGGVPVFKKAIRREVDALTSDGVSFLSELTTQTGSKLTLVMSRNMAGSPFTIRIIGGENTGDWLFSAKW